MSQATLLSCPQCATQIPPELLACPLCQRLVHAQRLKELSEQANHAAQSNNPTEALTLWRQALQLLPPNSRQHAAIAQIIQSLANQLPAFPRPARPPGKTQAASPSGRALGLLAATALLIWKLKFVLVFLLTKGKLLLLGLTKSSTFLSMFLSFAVYWTVLGWPFALGLVLSIYIHEMGHVEALRRYGFHATAPMFIPGLGALIRLKQHPANPAEDARIGLAGPLWGAAAALLAAALWLTTRNPLFGALAHVGAWINLFNLLPLWQLDGGRGFAPLSRPQAWLLTLLIAALWFTTAESLLLLLLIAAFAQAFAKKTDIPGDKPALILYATLLILLALLTTLQLPLPP